MQKFFNFTNFHVKLRRCQEKLVLIKYFESTWNFFDCLIDKINIFETETFSTHRLHKTFTHSDPLLADN